MFTKNNNFGGYSKTRKNIKKALKILSIFALVGVGTLLLGWAIMRSPAVQTLMGNKIASIASQTLGSNVTVGKFRFNLRRGLTIHDITLRCPNGDTLAHINQFATNLRNISVNERIAVLRSVTLVEPEFFIERADSSFNFAFLTENKNDTIAFSTDSAAMPFNINVNSIIVENGLVHYKSDQIRHEVDEFNLIINNVHWGELSASANLDSLSFNLNGQPFTKHASVEIVYSANTLQANDLQLKLSHSSINIPTASLNFGNNQPFAYSVNLNQAHICPNDFSAFATFLKGQTDIIKASGNISGTESTITGNSIALSIDTTASLATNFHLNNIDNLQELNFNISVTEARSSANKILSIINRYSKDDATRLSAKLSPIGTFNFVGQAKGSLNNLRIDGKLSTALGKLQVHSQLQSDEKTNGLRVDGSLRSTNINLNAYAGNNAMARIDVTAKGLIANNYRSNVIVNGSICHIQYNHYSIDSIRINGQYKGKEFVGNISSFDQNLRFDFNGQVNLGDSSSANFKASLYNANLLALGLSPNNHAANLQFDIAANIQNLDIDHTDGLLELTNLYYYTDSAYFATDTIKLEAQSADSNSCIKLNSEFLTANIDGKYKLSHIASGIVNYGHRFMPKAIAHIGTTPDTTSHFNFTVLADYPQPITDMFMPELQIASGSSISGEVNGNSGEVDVLCNFHDVDAYGVSAENLQVRIFNDNKYFMLRLASDSLFFGNIGLASNLRIDSYFHSDSIDTNISWDNRQMINNSGDIITSFVKQDSQMVFSIERSEYLIMNQPKSIEPATIIIRDSSIIVNHLAIGDAQSFLKMDGTISANPTDSIDIRLKNINLDKASQLLRLSTTFSGNLTANAVMRDLKNERIIKGNLNVDSLLINHTHIGNLEASTAWDADRKLILVDGNVQSSEQSFTQFNGNVNPQNAEIDIDVDAQKQEMAFLMMFLNGIFSNIDGQADGQLHLSGALPDLHWDGKLWSNNLKLHLLSTNVPYWLTDTVYFSDRTIHFRNTTGVDKEGNTLKINGSIWHSNLSIFNLDIKATSNKIIGIDTKSTQSPIHYGKIYASGMANIYGSSQRTITIDIGATSLQQSKYVISLEGRSDLAENDFLTFVAHNAIDDELAHNATNEAENLSGPKTKVNINLNLKITPDAEVQIVLDPKIGDALWANGSADLSISVADDDYAIYGTYLIDKGSFTFTMSNVISKKLDIQSGSSVTLNGKPSDAIVDIDAVYKLRRVPIFDLTKDEEDREKRVPVNCHLLMTGKLESPSIKFSVEVPSTTSNNEVVEQLNNLPEENLNQQIIYLLVLNKFAPLPNATAQNNANSSGTKSTATTASEVLSNQLSKWISQISNDFDLGFAYRPETDISNEEYELALSTTLWNDRLIINSNLGMSGQQNNTATTNNNSQFTTDISAELKVNKAGNLRLRAFQKVNDDLIYDAPYTRGVGFLYTEEFNDLKHLRSKIFTRRQQKKENKAEAKKEDSPTVESEEKE